ncbi:thiamine pyrophosphate-binding protein [Streptomyces sp. NPDC060053]|uniref:thiamine pyrophosphate-binding protein n=1 Tax=Streptomyces sp. NPDC060053 TaxID=3347047 RepID=UPI00367B80C6
MLVHQAVSETLQQLQVTCVFGLMGRANMRLVLSLVQPGDQAQEPDHHCPRYVAARHEGAAVNMADAYARASGRLGVCTVSLGPAVTNCVTGLAEAAAASTPLLVLTGERPTGRPHSGRDLDQQALFASLGLPTRPLRSPATAVRDLYGAARQALRESRPVVVPVPADLPDRPLDTSAVADLADLAGLEPPHRSPLTPSPESLGDVCAALEAAVRPVVLAGRGALGEGAADALRSLADRLGAVLATTMPASGLFAGHPFDLGTIGMHGSPLSVDLLADADLVLAFGAGLNPFTTRAGHLLPAVRHFVRVDVDAAAAPRPPATSSLVGDSATTARALESELARRGVSRNGWRTEPLRERIARAVRPLPPRGEGAAGFVEPRTALALLDEWLPPRRTVVAEPGHGCGYALEYLTVREPRAAVHLVDSQSIGLGLAAAVGAAAARPDRITVAAVGDGSALMSLGELETLVRHQLPVLVVVINDGAYGAEVRELELRGLPPASALFPVTELGAVAQALGMPAVTVRAPDDLLPVRRWIDAPRGPFLADCRVDPAVPADWFMEAIGGPTAYLRSPLPLPAVVQDLPTPLEAS